MLCCRRKPVLSNGGRNDKLATIRRRFYKQNNVPAGRGLLPIWPITALLLLDWYWQTLHFRKYPSYFASAFIASVQGWQKTGPF